MTTTACAARHCYLDDEEVAKVHGIEIEELPFAMRRGDVPLPSAQTIHGKPLWRTDSLRGACQ